MLATLALMDKRTPANKASEACAEALLDSMPRRTWPHKSGSQLAVRVALTEFSTPPALLAPLLEPLPPTPREPESPAPRVGHKPARLDDTCACAPRYAASAATIDWLAVAERWINCVSTGSL